MNEALILFYIIVSKNSVTLYIYHIYHPLRATAQPTRSSSTYRTPLLSWPPPPHRIMRTHTYTTSLALVRGWLLLVYPTKKRLEQYQVQLRVTYTNGRTRAVFLPSPNNNLFICYCVSVCLRVHTFSPTQIVSIWCVLFFQNFKIKSVIPAGRRRTSSIRPTKQTAAA